MASLSEQGGIVNSNTLAFVRRANQALEKWWEEFDELHSAFSIGVRIYRIVTTSQAKQWIRRH